MSSLAISLSGNSMVLHSLPSEDLCSFRSTSELDFMLGKQIIKLGPAQTAWLYYYCRRLNLYSWGMWHPACGSLLDKCRSSMNHMAIKIHKFAICGYVMYLRIFPICYKNEHTSLIKQSAISQDFLTIRTNIPLRLLGSDPLFRFISSTWLLAMS